MATTQKPTETPAPETKPTETPQGGTEAAKVSKKVQLTSHKAVREDH